MKNLTLVFLILLSAMCIQGARLRLKGSVYSKATSKDVPGAFVEILSQDSTVLASDTAFYVDWDYNSHSAVFLKDTLALYTLEIEKAPGDYIVRVTKEGYETRYMDYPLTDLQSREFERNMPKIYISPQREATTLDELTVKATKIKFYNKGDTIVYNADAFNLPEGSMLDALIEQMPGVEIRDGGEIYVNGRYVESLLLNGKDFFKGNKNVMLENIGVYTVKDIAVYEKQGEMSKLMDTRMEEDMEYVMDVRLKKEYQTGTLANFEAGGGTKDRWLGRLFAMRYTDNSRLSVYGNANNTNNLARPTDGRGTPVYMGEGQGVTTIANGGVDYFIDNPLHTFEATGNVDVKYSDNKVEQDMTRVNLLSTGDTYDYSFQRDRTRDLTVYTEHSFKIRKDYWNLSVNPDFKYSHRSGKSSSDAASFTEELKEASEQLIRDIYSNDYQKIRKSLINRNRISSESREHGWRGHLWVENAYRIKGSPDGFTFWFETSYDRSNPETDNLQTIDFGETPAASTRLWRHTDNYPQYKYMLRASGRYYWNFPFGNVSLGGYYEHNQNRRNSMLYMMQADAEDEEAEFLPDQLPVPDEANSYTSKLYQNSVVVMPRFNFRHNGSYGTIWYDGELKAIYDHRHLFYHQGSVTANPAKSMFFINSGNVNFRWNNSNDKLTLYVGYRYAAEQADLVNTIDVINDTDPLNIQLGNPDLKARSNHSIYLSGHLNMPQNATVGIYGNFKFGGNDITRGYRYDTATGVRTYKSYNVDGNSNGYLQLSYSRDLWLQGLGARIQLSGQFYNYSNMIGENAEPTKQTIHQKSIGPSLNIYYGYKRIFFIGYFLGYNKSWSSAQGNLAVGFNPSIVENNFSLTIVPFKNFTFNTYFQIIKRNGYIDSSLNDTRFLLNPGIEYKFRNWSFTLNANDVLNQMQNISYVVDAQARTQTLTNILPRHIMLSVKYSFDLKPGKKNAAQKE